MTPGSVAVVIPSHDAAAFIDVTLGSVLAQTRPADEIVVVDDHSSDDTRAIVARYPGVRLLVNPGTGSNIARATAIDATATEYVALLDHDDYWYPAHLQTLVGLLETQPACAAAFGAVRPFRDDPVRVPPGTGSAREIDPWSAFPLNSVGTPSAVVARRAALEQVGGWPRWNRVPTDVYIWLRLAEAGPFVSWSGCTVGYRVHRSLSWHAAVHDLERHSASRLALLRDALDARGAWEGRETATARLAVGTAVSDVLLAMVGEQPGRVAAAAAVLAERLEELGPLGAGPALAVLRSAVNVRLVESADARTRFVRSYLDWPRDRLALRADVADPLLPAAMLSGVRRDPWRPARWHVPMARGVHRAVVPLARAGLRSSGRRVRSLSATRRSLGH